MLTELAGLMAAASETALTEAAEAAAVVAEAVEVNAAKDLLAAAEKAANGLTEALPRVEPMADPLKHLPETNVLKQALANGAKGELALDAIEAAEAAEEAEAAGEVSEYKRVESLRAEQELSRVGRSLIPPMHGSCAAQFSRICDRAATLMKEAAMRSSEEAALAGETANAEHLQKTAELMDDISRFSDAAGDYLGIASYPEYMARHSPGSR